MSHLAYSNRGEWEAISKLQSQIALARCLRCFPWAVFGSGILVDDTAAKDRLMATEILVTKAGRDLWKFQSQSKISKCLC